MNDSMRHSSSSHRTNNNDKQVSKKLKKFARFKKESGEEDIKDYAASTMNELLAWYGYDKFDARDTQTLQLASTSSEDSASNSPIVESGPENIVARQSNDCDDCVSVDVDNDENSDEPPDSSCRSPNNEAMTEDHNSKESSEDASNIPAGYILCAWCQKVGIKLFTLRTTNGCKAFCSELCFTQCRRASFKKNKVCDWCKHVRHTVNYVDFQDGEQQLQFCSDKCLNQYKMNIFCEETQAQLQLHPHLQESSAKFAGNNSSDAYITPDLWMKACNGDDRNEFRNNDYRGSDHSDSEHESPQESSSTCLPLKRKVMEPINNKNGNSNDSAINFVRREKERESKRQKHSSYLNGNNENSRRFVVKEAKEMSNAHQPGLMHYKPMSVFATRNSNSVPRMPNLTAASHIPMSSPVGSQVSVSAFSPPAAAPTVNSYFGSLPVNGAVNRDHLRPPLITPSFVRENSYAEMMRIQRAMRNPLPLPFAQIPGQQFSGIHHMRPSNFTRLPHPSPSTIPHPYYSPNSPVLPPVTVMVPCPFMLPIPIPVPIPFPIPIRKHCDHSCSEVGVQVNMDNINEKWRSRFMTNNNNNASVCFAGNEFGSQSNANARKFESVITKLVEKRNKANREPNALNFKTNLCPIESDCRSDQIESRDSPQNLIVTSRGARSLDTPLTN